MIPNLSPILITLGFMGWAGIPLDTFTLLIGSIALGLAVDDTIHFFHNYIRYYKRGGNPHRAVQETLLSTGARVRKPASRASSALVTRLSASSPSVMATMRRKVAGLYMDSG